MQCAVQCTVCIVGQQLIVQHTSGTSLDELLSAISFSLSRQCALCYTAAAVEPWRVKAALSKSRSNDEAAPAAASYSCP